MPNSISIVIPTHNRSACLRKTLDSLKEQSFSDFEVIVSDDGSTDDTESVVKQNLWPFPVLYFGHKKKGSSFSRNFGVKQGSAPLILFLDDHVFLDPDCLGSHYLFHQELAGTAYQIVRCRAFHLKECEKVPPVKILKPVTFREKLDEQNPWVTFFTCNTSLRKEAFEKVGGFDEKFTEYGFEDNELGYRLSRAGYKFKINPEAVGYIFSPPVDFSEQLGKARQVGHMAVVFARKYPSRKFLVGVHFFNYLVYQIFAFFPGILKRLEAGYREAEFRQDSGKKDFYEFWLKHYNFLAGIEEAKEKTWKSQLS